MISYIKTPSTNKAKLDIDILCDERGYRNIAIGNGSGKISKFFQKLATVAMLPFRLRKGDVLLIQYPYKKYYRHLCRAAHWRKAKTVTLIHDLGSFRRKKLTPEQEIKRLSDTDFIIVHNSSMRKWLIDHGCLVPMHDLDIFDYLSDAKPTGGYEKSAPNVVLYAGGLGPRKNRFLYDIDPLLGDCRMEVYGKGLEPGIAETWKRIAYKGFVPSDRFISEANGHWGLVWDGDSVDECNGEWGEYLRYNNPHKTSFYLRAGIPVIIWEKSAMAPFITANNLGIAVSSLRELDKKLNAMTLEEYAVYRREASTISDRLQQGAYFGLAMDKALKQLSD